MPGNEDLLRMVQTLRKMNPGFHAPVDGKGIYLGNGLPRMVSQEIRSEVLADALQELLTWRLFFDQKFVCINVDGRFAISMDAQEPS